MAHLERRTWAGTATAATRAARRPCRYEVYLPDRLTGRPLRMAGDQAADVSDVERQLAQLNAAHPGLVNLEALARLLLRAEAVASSFIEGLRINVRRLAKEDLAGRSGLGSIDDTARAVLGNVAALESALTVADAGRDVTVQDVRDLHARLLAGTRDEAWGGRLREEQNWVGGTGLTPCTAEFVPPPPELVPELLQDLCAYLSGDEHPALVQAALAHAQFETIHPFADGNGRTGRALIHLVLRRRGLTPHFVPPISLVLATHADAYVAGLTAYRYTGDPETAAAQAGTAAWLDRFIADVATACADARRFTGELDELEASWRERVGPVRANSTVDLLLRALPSMPVLTVNTAAERLGRSVPRTNEAVARLATAGVLEQTTLGRRNRGFEVPDLVGAITGFERALASPAGDTRRASPARPVPSRID
jgi:Fic family protein